MVTKVAVFSCGSRRMVTEARVFDCEFAVPANDGLKLIGVHL
jgi:hypothetical protein